MASGLLSLKWNNHKSTFFHVLSSIRSKESYCDATLACDGRFYPVHKLVLSTCSEYFEQMFEKTQCKHPVIVLKDIKFDDLEALLNYMYVGEVNVLQDRLAGLIKAAECLKIKGLAVPDEDPAAASREKRSHRGDHLSPHSKRKRRDHSHSEDRDKTNSNRRDLHRRTSLETSDDRLKNSDNRSSDSFHETEGIDGADVESNREESMLGTSQKDVPEVYLDEMGVKSEPPDIEETEEVTESKETLHTDLGFDPNQDESLPEGDIEGSNSNEDYGEGGLTPQSVEEVVAQAMPSSSNFQGNSFPSWEGEGSLQNFPDESFGGENSQGRPMVDDERERPSSFKVCTSLLKCNQISPHLDDHLYLQMQYEKSGKFQLHFCTICHKSFVSLSKLERHTRIHTGEKPFPCSFCNYRSAQKENLSTHLRFHCKGKRYFCHTCHSKFPTEAALEEHSYVCNSDILQTK